MIKRTKHDAIFSDLIRERADYCCERCGKNCRNGRLDCSHIFGRRHTRTRWEPDNAQALCYSCHNWFGENPYEAGLWLESIYGSGYMEILREKKNSVYKMKPAEKEEMYKHYKEEYRKMMYKRGEGVEGRIEFEGWF